MKKFFITSGFIIALIAFVSAGFSQTKTPRVHKRQVNQHERIAEGAKDGALTKRETIRMEARQAKIKKDKKEVKADGVVTNKESAKLHREQKRSSRAIYRQKHDAQTRK
ncbi:MAG: hypothetical protein QM768_13605 [Agriterribacter sp.]